MVINPIVGIYIPWLICFFFCVFFVRAIHSKQLQSAVARCRLCLLPIVISPHPLPSNFDEGIWVFPKIRVGPQNGWFIMENPIKLCDLEIPKYPDFWKHPYRWISFRSHVCVVLCFFPHKFVLCFLWCSPPRSHKWASEKKRLIMNRVLALEY